MDGRIFDLRNDLINNLGFEWNVEKMAARAGLSVSHFPTIFKAALGTSPGTYLKVMRLERAKYLLETTHIQIKQIGIQMSMSNQSHFTRDFKLGYGLSPTDHRRQFNDNQQAGMQNGRK